MSWKNILKEVRGSHRRRFDFNNLDFYQDDEGTGLLKDPMAYEKYEVMLNHPSINHPKEIGIMENTMVFPYLTKEEITEYARKVEANLPSKLKEKKQKKNLGRLVDAFKE